MYTYLYLYTQICVYKLVFQSIYKTANLSLSFVAGCVLLLYLEGAEIPTSPVHRWCVILVLHREIYTDIVCVCIYMHIYIYMYMERDIFINVQIQYKCWGTPAYCICECILIQIIPKYSKLFGIISDYFRLFGISSNTHNNDFIQLYIAVYLCMCICN